LARNAEAGTWHLENLSHQSIAGLMGGILDEMRKGGARNDFSFTDRTLAQLAESPVALTPDDLLKLPTDISTHVLLSEGLQDGATDLCTSIWRAPGGSVSSPGRKGRFRLAVLVDEIQRYFVGQGYRSFGAPNPTDPPGIFRPDHGRELYVRLGQARRMERDPIERHKRMQEAWARERELLPGSKATAEERAAIQEEIKREVGLTPVAPAQPSPAPVIEQPAIVEVPGGGWALTDEQAP
jgi:hypothetical protein